MFMLAELAKRTVAVLIIFWVLHVSQHMIGDKPAVNAMIDHTQECRFAYCRI